MYPNHPFYADQPDASQYGGLRVNDALGAERLDLSRDKFDAQQDQFGAMQALRQQDARRKALESMMKFRGVGSAGIQDALYSQMTGGQIPGATRHNELMDRDRFWRNVHGDNMERQAQSGSAQGLYRVGDEYGFNGTPMGHLSERPDLNPDEFFNQLQGQHHTQRIQATQQQEANPSSMFRQAAAQQQAQMRMKQSADSLSTFKKLGIEPAYALQDFDAATNQGWNPQTQMLHTPGGGRFIEDDNGNPVWRYEPSRQVPLPLPMRSRIKELLAQQSGFESAEQMEAEALNAVRQKEQAALQAQQFSAAKEAEFRRLEQMEREEQDATRQQGSVMHRLRLFQDPAYQAQFFGELGNESQAMRGAVQDNRRRLLGGRSEMGHFNPSMMFR